MSNRFQPIPSGTSQEQMLAIINRNFAELDAETTTKVFYNPLGGVGEVNGLLPNGLGTGMLLKDNNGNNSIAMYVDANGAPILRVAETGKDAVTGADEDLIFNSVRPVFKIALEGTTTITVASGANQTGTSVITHNLNYNPLVFGTVTLPPALSSEIMQFPGAYYVWDGVSRYQPRLVFEYFSTNPNSLTLQVRSDGFAGGDYLVKYFILQQTAN